MYHLKRIRANIFNQEPNLWSVIVLSGVVAVCLKALVSITLLIPYYWIIYTITGVVVFVVAVYKIYTKDDPDLG